MGGWWKGSIRPRNLKKCEALLEFPGGLGGVGDGVSWNKIPPMRQVWIFSETTHSVLKEHCHEDFAVLGQFCAKIITLRL